MSDTATTTEHTEEGSNALSALVLAAVALDIKPVSTDEAGLEAWMKQLTESKTVIDTASKLTVIAAGTVKQMQKQAAGQTYILQLDDVDFVDRSQRFKLQFIKRNRAGEIVKHDKYGKGDSGSTERIDSRDPAVAAKAKELGEFAKENMGKIVEVTKVKEERNGMKFSTIVDMKLTDIEPV